MTRFRYWLGDCEVWIDLPNHHQIITAGKNAKDAHRQAKAAMKDYQRRKREGEFDDEWYND
jgi:hypothetical protein